MVVLLASAVVGSLSSSIRYSYAAPPSNSRITLSPTAGSPGTVVTVNGTDFKGNPQITLYFDQTRISTTTQKKGNFSATVTIPSSASAGSHIIKAVGVPSNYSAQAPFSVVSTDWPQFGFDPNHTYFNPYENVLTSANVSNLTQDWTYTTNSYIRSSPAVVNGVVYIASSSGMLYAFNTATGALLWSHSIGFYTDSSPSVANGIV